MVQKVHGQYIIGRHYNIWRSVLRIVGAHIGKIHKLWTFVTLCIHIGIKHFKVLNVSTIHEKDVYKVKQFNINSISEINANILPGAHLH